MLTLDLRLTRESFTLSVDARLEGGVTGLFGRSGAGKTTLLHLLAGLTRPDAGRITLDGDVLVDRSQGIDVPPHLRRMAVVFQDARLFPHYSVQGNLKYGWKRLPPRDRRFAVEEVARLLEIDHLVDRRVRHLSGGERQRVALGRALLASPRMLLLDEPLASLDRPRRRQILPFLRRVRDHLDVPMLYVSHEIDEILQLTDQVMILDEGRSAGLGRYTDLALDEAVLSHHPDLLNVLDGVVDEVETGAITLRLVVDPARPGGGQPLRAASAPVVEGQTAVALVRPEDIALARQPVEGISIQNQIAGRVTRLTAFEGRVLVEVDVGVPLLVVVGERARGDLELAPGLEVWCLVKVNAIEVRPA